MPGVSLAPNLVLTLSCLQSMMAERQAGMTEEDAAAQAWLQDAKVKLIAQKKVERQAEIDAYKKAQKVRGTVGTCLQEGCERPGWHGVRPMAVMWAPSSACMMRRWGSVAQPPLLRRQCSARAPPLTCCTTCLQAAGGGKPAAGGAGGSAAAGDDTEAKRAALRDKLASRFKQDLLGPQ